MKPYDTGGCCLPAAPGVSPLPECSQAPLSLPWGRQLAVPSWVRAGTVAENCAFLHGRVPGVALMFLESEACLAYTAHDLPSEMADWGMDWHVHLPTDLQWERPEHVAKVCLQLMGKTSFLKARKAVLHGPVTSDRNAFLRALTTFLSFWEQGGRSAGEIFLENLLPAVGGHSKGVLVNAAHARTALFAELALLCETAENLGCGLCFDTGHHLLGALLAGLWPETLESHNHGAARHLSNLTQQFLQHAGIIHWSYPVPESLAAAFAGRVPGGRHASLACLGMGGEHTAPITAALWRDYARQAPQHAVHVLEVFDWEGCKASAAVLSGWLC